MKSKKKKCFTSDQIWFWTVAGYIAYTAVLYAYRKPACEYAAKICSQANQS